jgi:hypothetical protein
MTSETEEMNALKERVAELEQDNRFLSERLRAIEKRFEQMDEVRMLREEADNDRRHGYYGYW